MHRSRVFEKVKEGRRPIPRGSTNIEKNGGRDGASAKRRAFIIRSTQVREDGVFERKSEFLLRG